ncbi:unnamed protein product, partial [Prorocentrum cordatum]
VGGAHELRRTAIGFDGATSGWVLPLAFRQDLSYEQRTDQFYDMQMTYRTPPSSPTRCPSPRACTTSSPKRAQNESKQFTCDFSHTVEEGSRYVAELNTNQPLDMYAEMAETNGDELKAREIVDTCYAGMDAPSMTDSNYAEMAETNVEHEAVDTCYAGTEDPSMTDSIDEIIPVEIRDAINQAIASKMTRLTGSSEEMVCSAIERVFDATVSHPFWEQDGAVMAVNDLAIDYNSDLDAYRGLH